MIFFRLRVSHNQRWLPTGELNSAPGTPYLYLGRFPAKDRRKGREKGTGNGR